METTLWKLFRYNGTLTADFVSFLGMWLRITALVKVTGECLELSPKNHLTNPWENFLLNMPHLFIMLWPERVDEGSRFGDQFLNFCSLNMHPLLEPLVVLVCFFRWRAMWLTNWAFIFRGIVLLVVLGLVVFFLKHCFISCFRNLTSFLNETVESFWHFGLGCDCFQTRQHPISRVFAFHHAKCWFFQKHNFSLSYNTVFCNNSNKSNKRIMGCHQPQLQIQSRLLFFFNSIIKFSSWATTANTATPQVRRRCTWSTRKTSFPQTPTSTNRYQWWWQNGVVQRAKKGKGENNYRCSSSSSSSARYHTTPTHSNM